MTQVPSVGQTTGSNTLGDTGDRLAELDVDHFLNLLIAELQNQDPLNPLDNAQMMAQISQMREIGSTDKLTDTLDAVLTGQNLNSAASLIGKEIRALDTNAENVVGVVDRVSVVDGVPKLHIGSREVTLNNVGEIRSSGDGDDNVEE